MKSVEVFYMRGMKFLPLLILFCLQSVPALGICKTLLLQMKQRDVFSKQPALRNAADAVIRERMNQGIEIPKLSAKGPAADKTLQKNQKQLTVQAVYEDIKLEAAGSEEGYRLVTHRSGRREVALVDAHYRREYGNQISKVEPVPAHYAQVRRMILPGGIKYFRPVDGEDGSTRAARELAAYTISNALEAETVPVTRWGMVNGELGAISDDAPGYEPRRKLAETVAEKRCYEDSAWEAQAVEFLLGNMDGVKRNTHIGTDGVVRVFDHDLAFELGIVPAKGQRVPEQSEVLVGAELPDFYTEKFARNLRALTPQRIHTLLHLYISKKEIEGVIFRREIMLKDFELRPESILADN